MLEAGAMSLIRSAGVDGGGPNAITANGGDSIKPPTTFLPSLGVCLICMAKPHGSQLSLPAPTPIDWIKTHQTQILESFNPHN